MEELEKQMDERISMALEIAGWGLIAVGISLLLLKLLGVESKFELLWDEFKRRKSL